MIEKPNYETPRVVSVRFSERDYQRIARVAGGNVSGFIRQAARWAVAAHGVSMPSYFVCNQVNTNGITNR